MTTLILRKCQSIRVAQGIHEHLYIYAGRTHLCECQNAKLTWHLIGTILEKPDILGGKTGGGEGGCTCICVN